MKSFISAFLILAAFASPAFASQKPLDAAEQLYPNLLGNPGFENGSALWTASGGAIKAANATAKGQGSFGYDWDSNSAGQTLVSALVPIPAGVRGRNGVAYCGVKTPTGTLTTTVQVDDGTNLVGPASTVATTATMFGRTPVNFVFPQSGSVRLKFISVAADEPEAYFDTCYIGEAHNIGQVGTTQSPTLQVFTTSGTYTVPAPAPAYLEIEALGAGGAGGSSGTGMTSANFGAAGGNTIFGSGAIISAGGGTGGQNPSASTSGGAGGTNVVGAPAVAIDNFAGGQGSGVSGNNGAFFAGAPGGINPCLAGEAAVGYSNGLSGPANTGAGGAGAGTGATSVSPGNGGGAGGCLRALILNPVAGATYTVTIGGGGAPGTAGTNGSQGGTGSSGRVKIREFYANASLSTYRSTTEPAYWAGYHDNTCSWARTNTAYGDPATDSTCNLVPRKNTNFGAVTSYGGASALPGIVFTPPRLGTYWVCAAPKFVGSGLASVVDTQLWDQTNIIAESEEQVFVAANQQFLPTCGLYVATSTTVPATLSLRTKATSGSVTLQASSTNASAIEWSIIAIDQGLTAPVIVGSLNSNSTVAERVERVRMNVTCSTSPCAIADQSGSWVSSITRLGTGVYSVNFSTGVFSATPTCLVTHTVSAGSANLVGVYSISSTGAGVESQSAVSSPEDMGFSMICMGPR